MNSYDLLNTMFAALTDDADLSTKTNAWYGADHLVFIDQDTVDPPGEEDGPVLIQLHSPAKSAAEDERVVEYGFLVSVEVNDNADATRAETNAKEFSATARLDALVAQTIAVIRANKPDGWVMGFEYYTDTVNNFPVFVADIFIKFTERLTIGQDPLG